MSKTGISQPVTQKWLTNVVSVTLDVEGVRFEIACYSNKVRAFRSGVEKDLDQVLQTDTIFSDLVQGETHSSEKLLQAFQTTDRRTICSVILQRGKVQLTESERMAEQSRLMKEIVSLICQWTCCPATKMPYPAQLIEETLKQQLWFSPNAFPVPEQAAAVIKQLQQVVDLELKPISFQVEVFDANQIQIFEEMLQQMHADVKRIDNVLYCVGPNESIGAVKELIQKTGARAQTLVQKTFRLK